MKALSIRQPWATLVVKGIKDIENRTWKTDYRGKILIHAGSTNVPGNIYQTIPLELYSSMQNEIQFGNIEGNLGTYPKGAIIGYVDLTDIVKPGVEFEDATFDGGPEYYRWIFENAYEFDEPILGVKGKLNLYDIPEITEDNLPPAHKVELHTPFYNADDKVLFVPADKLYYDSILNGDFDRYNFHVQWDMEYMNTLVCREANFDFPVKTVIVVNAEKDEIRYVGFEAVDYGLFISETEAEQENLRQHVHPNENGEYVYDGQLYVVYFGREVNVDRYFHPDTPTPVPEQYEE